MKIILTQDVAKLGRRLAIVDVPDGRGMNQLIPQGLALPATPENIKKVTALKQHNAQQAESDSDQFNVAVQALGDTVVVLAVQANAQGHLFESLKPAKVAKALEAAGIKVHEKQVQIATPIKTTGMHEIMLVHGSSQHAATIDVQST